MIFSPFSFLTLIVLFSSCLSKSFQKPRAPEETTNRCIKTGLVGSFDSNVTYRLNSATTLFTNGHELQNLFRQYCKGSHFIFMGDSNVRFTVITLLHLIDPVGMKMGWKLRWNSSENGFPHLTFVDVVLKDGQVIYSSSTTPFSVSQELNLSNHREFFRVTFLWCPMSENVLPVVEKYIKSFNYHGLQLYLYLSLGLWDVAVPGSAPKPKDEVDLVMGSYCDRTISNLLSDYCFKNKLLCIVGSMPDFMKSRNGNTNIIDYGTMSQFKFCSTHACELLNKNMVWFDLRSISTALNSEEYGQHFSHIYGVISYLSIFKLFQEMFAEYSKSFIELLPDLNYTAGLPRVQKILFHNSCRRIPFQLDVPEHNDWVDRFCRYYFL